MHVHRVSMYVYMYMHMFKYIYTPVDMVNTYIYMNLYIFIYTVYTCIYKHIHGIYAHITRPWTWYGVITISRLLKIIGLFCRI